MNRIEKIMSQNKDKKNLYEKVRELVEYYKDQLRDETFTRLFDSYKVMVLSKEFSDKFSDIPERYKNALLIAIEELMAEKKEKMGASSPEMLEFNKYIDDEIEDARITIEETKKLMDNEAKTNSKEKAMAELQQDDNYKRFIVSYTEGNLSPTGETLLNSEFNKINHNMAQLTKNLAEEQKKKTKQ